MDAVAAKPPTRDDPVIEEVTRRLVEVYHPERIYLYGSAARGDAGPDSDYDFLVIVPNEVSDDVLRGHRGYEAIHDLHLHAHVLVQRRDYFYGRLHLRASLPAAAMREGKLVYGDHNGEVGMPRDPKARDEDTAEWLRKARNDIRVAEAVLSFHPPDTGNALFHCQQAIEKAFKAFLFWHDEPFRKTHELKELGTKCVRFDTTLAGLPERVEALTKASSEPRYPRPDPPVADAQEALALARETYDAILTRVPLQARP
jgi:HEPN domain-containing protein